MGKPLSFDNFVLLREGNSRTAAKTLLYPMSYGGIGLYPPLHYTPQAADAVLYISNDDRWFCNGDGPPFDIRHLPGHQQFGDKVNSGENKPFDIRDVPGQPKEPVYREPPGDTQPFKGFVKLVQVVKCLADKQSKMPPE
jgi:hypothetical protein